MVTVGEKDLSSLPTAATRAWAISDIVRMTRPPRGWTFDMAWGGVRLRGVVVDGSMAKPGRGNIGKRL